LLTFVDEESWGSLEVKSHVGYV